MFRSRTSTQKPADDLLADFRQQFPEVSAVNAEPSSLAISHGTGTITNSIFPMTAHERIRLIDVEAFQDLDPTPRASGDQWRFTPSLLDPGVFGFHDYVQNPTSPYYSPTPGGVGAMLPPHTPALAGMTNDLEAPLLVPTTTEVTQPSIEFPDMPDFQALEPNQLHHFDTFSRGSAVIVPHQVPLLTSNIVHHHDTGYETMDQDDSPMDSEKSDERHPALASTLQARQATSLPIGHGLPLAAENFRFLCTLNAPTAMIRQPDEIPLTYLNKAQVYSLLIVDTKALAMTVPGIRYRTFVRVSFEDEQQRQKPSLCWSLWKEGRGSNEAHQRGGKLQAVEYVEASQPFEGSGRRPRVELHSSSFDGFSVVWGPGSNGTAEVTIALRFNFLSTDFSHSKGVKGIPVRLCAKTSLVSPDPAQSGITVDPAPEICFCKVKLFRDHGAERKLSNDVAHAKKSVEKIKQQIGQAENGQRDCKRRRSSAIIKIGDTQRVAKVSRHRRTWSMSSTSSAGGGPRLSVEEDLHLRLQSLQAMFTSTRPVTVLYLRGEVEDDPDLHPVVLQGDSLAMQMDPPDGSHWQSRSARNSIADSQVSPSPSSLSLASQASALGSNAQWSNADSGQGNSGPKAEQPRAVATKLEEDGTLSGWIEALGVDPSYHPQPEPSLKAVACFYIANQGGEGRGEGEYYRAIYLARRTLENLNERIAVKWGLEPTRICRTIHVTRGGLEVEMDDEVVQEIREGQAMELEIEKMVKEEWDPSMDGRDEKSQPRCNVLLRLRF